MDIRTLIDQIENGEIIAFIPRRRAPEHRPRHALSKRWYSPQEVADMPGFGI